MLPLLSDFVANRRTGPAWPHSVRRGLLVVGVWCLALAVLGCLWLVR